MAEQRAQRRLAAILAADVVGYARLIGADETGTLTLLRAVRKELVEPTLKRHHGHIVKLMGDGLLAEFASVVNAVAAAVEIQEAMPARSAHLPEDRAIAIRIGVNLGDVVAEDGDLFGDGVNIAARLQELAEPNGVAISGDAYRQLGGKLDVPFADAGERVLKNIEAPVQTWLWPSAGMAGDRPLPDPPAPALPDKPSIAVLPFANMSGDPEQDYFSDGLVEDLITDISKISGLFVIARNSSFAFKGQAGDVREIARKLGVQHVVEGSVRKMGSKLRINAQLIDAASGGHLWAERYDGDMANVFAFQDDIREQIVAALEVSLTPSDRALAERKPTDSVEAYDLLLKGRASFYNFTREHHLAAVKCLEAAIEIDPKFADAYGYLSFCHFYGWAFMWPGFDDDLDRAYELAEKGVALDGTSPIALARLGWIQTILRRYRQAIANFETAIALAPNNAEAYAEFGAVLCYWGDPTRALEMLGKAFTIDTIVPSNWEFRLGQPHLLLREYGEALAAFDRAIERAPKFIPAQMHAAWAYVELSRLDDARAAIEQVLEFAPQYTLKAVGRIYPYRLDEHRNRMLDSLRKAGLPEG